jgi:hypothetical protein
MINVISKTCQYEGCTTRPTFGQLGHHPIHCAQHKEVGEKTHPLAKCQIVNCKNLAIFGYTSANHCEIHKTAQEVDLVQRRCVSCGLLDILDQQGLCPTCDPTQMRRIMLAKQKNVRDFFDYQKMKYISYDRMIDHGVCGKERPDFIFDCGTHMLAIEVDEHQHDGYPCECEQTRMINIGQSLGMRVLFIRYNPDKYKPTSGRANNNVQKRMESIKRQIEHWQTNPLPTDGVCFVTHLYYDGDDPTMWKNVVKLL